MVAIETSDFRVVVARADTLNTEGPMYTAEASITVTCPNCRWTASGPDLHALKEAKEHHATYQCPDYSPLAQDEKIIE
jgi:hypothetical protein